MAFELRADRSIDDDVRRLACEQLTEAIELLRDPHREGLTTSVHEARKRTKMVRALARLMAAGIGRDRRTVNRLLRDGSAELSEMRDAHALLATWDRLAGTLPALVELTPAREALATRSDGAAASPDDPRLARAIERFERARDIASNWDLPDGLGAVRVGLRTGQRRSRDALAAVRRDGTDEHLHELRKRMKDLWYYSRLLRPAAPSMLDAYEETLHALSDALGDDHDLAVLVQQALAQSDAFGGDTVVATLEEAVGPARAELQRRALGVSARVLAERPKAFSRRLTAYLELWHELGDELPAGAVDEVLGE